MKIVFKIYFLKLSNSSLSIFFLLLTFSLQPIYGQIETSQPFIMVLGVAQDAGYPQMGCNKECCQSIVKGISQPKRVASIALVDSLNNKYWLFDATPDIAEQVNTINQYLNQPLTKMPESIFLTHAHIGHYTGLMYFGREVMGAKRQKVYSMPRMSQFLNGNGPWSQLIKLENIQLNPIEENTPIKLSENLLIKALRVPHRDEFSETVGYMIEIKNSKVLFIPDIDKWNKWEQDIKSLIEKVDLAYLDGTFYQNGEIEGRDMREIPHPFVAESMAIFNDLPLSEKKKIRFIHLNHTNPLLRKSSKEYKDFQKTGFGLAEQDEIIRF